MPAEELRQDAAPALLLEQPNTVRAPPEVERRHKRLVEIDGFAARGTELLERVGSGKLRCECLKVGQALKHMNLV